MTLHRARGAAIWLALALMAASVATLSRTRALTLRNSWPPEADVLYLPTTNTVRRMALGHTELAADLVAVRTNVYFGTQLAQRGAQLWLNRYLEAASDLDPWFKELYPMGAAMLIYNGRAISVEAVEKANQLLRRGLTVFPDDWELWFQVGFNECFELPKLVGRDDPRITGWRQSGIEAMQRATSLPDVPPWLPNLAARILTKQGQDDLAIKHLERAFAATTHPETQAQILAKLRELRAAQLTDRLSAERNDFEARLRHGYPYAPEAFNVLVGPRVGSSGGSRADGSRAGGAR